MISMINKISMNILNEMSVQKINTDQTLHSMWSSLFFYFQHSEKNFFKHFQRQVFLFAFYSNIEYYAYKMSIHVHAYCAAGHVARKLASGQP